MSWRSCVLPIWLSVNFIIGSATPGKNKGEQRNKYSQRNIPKKHFFMSGIFQPQGHVFGCSSKKCYRYSMRQAHSNHPDLSRKNLRLRYYAYTGVRAQNDEVDHKQTKNFPIGVGSAQGVHDGNGGHQTQNSKCQQEWTPSDPV